jgi:7,8-dihydro-6-hydroxymethylpterin-pyrophosphokinase
MQNRKFVLIPLSELVPQLIHPKLNLSVNEMLTSLKDSKKVHLLRA